MYKNILFAIFATILVSNKSMASSEVLSAFFPQETQVALENYLSPNGMPFENLEAIIRSIPLEVADQLSNFYLKKCCDTIPLTFKAWITESGRIESEMHCGEVTGDGIVYLANNGINYQDYMASRRDLGIRFGVTASDDKGLLLLSFNEFKKIPIRVVQGEWLVFYSLYHPSITRNIPNTNLFQQMYGEYEEEGELHEE